MRSLLIILLSVFTLSVSCSKGNLFRAKCINDRIQEMKDADCDDAKVEKWYFIGRSVYVFDPGSCDTTANQTVSITDDNCVVICYMGGFAGSPGHCDGSNSFEDPLMKITIWEK